ncbi:MAG: hypothetical protein KDM91_10615, partial [Verrucomicrobiae bacterium]|nr:hypothetical protein [Verrucomicrobiae bacterium]
NATDPSDTATQGDAVPGLGGPLFSTFIGETIDRFGFPLVRATLAGPGVTRADNEVLYSQSNGVIVRKGDEPEPVSEPGIRIARFLAFWPGGNNNVLFLVKRSGPGITRANDCALYAWRGGEAGYVRILCEGDAVCGCDCPRLGTIQRVDMEPYFGRGCLVLASLTGVSRSSNQALFTADPNSAIQAFRKGSLALRKGSLYHSSAPVTTGIRSMTFHPSQDPNGAGGKGLGQAVNDYGGAALILTFDNRAVEVVSGTP